MPHRRATARSSRPLVAPALLAVLLAVSTCCAGGAPSDAVPSTLTTRLGAVSHHHHGHHGGPPRSVDCQYSDRTTGANWDFRQLSLPLSAYVFHDEMTDLAHDSVHAAQRAAEKEAARAAEAKKPVSGRLLDSGAAKAKADKTDEPPKPTINTRVHHHNPDSYDFHINVCANVAHKPPICADKPDAPGYQVVVPKTVEEEEEEESTDFYADDDSYYGTGDEGGGRAGDDAALERWRKRQAEPVRRAARAAPEPTECHALGSLDNVTWGLIVPGKPELGLELRYSGGDNCLKRVVKKRQPGDPPPTSALPEVSWVPVPRQLTLRMRCDPAAPAAIDPFDPAAVMQLARRVRIVEAEMCVYEAEWPTAAACPTMKPRVAAVVAAKARHAVFPAVLVLGLAAAVVTQAARHRRTLRALARRVRAGDTGALRAVFGVLAAKDASEASFRSRRHSSAGHEI